MLSGVIVLRFILLHYKNLLFAEDGAHLREDLLVVSGHEQRGTFIPLRLQDIVLPNDAGELLLPFVGHEANAIVPVDDI